MSDTHDTNVHDQHGPAHAAADGQGNDAHGGGEALGPIDWTMWGVGVVGVVAALLVVAGFVLATGFAFGA
ncbi:MAG: hypothetical protein ACYC65_14080 [Candidatus Limnocylindrales bacterium]